MTSTSVDQPLTMRAWTYTGKKATIQETLVFTKECDVPVPGADQVLIKVSHAALNPVFYKVMLMAPGLAMRKFQVPEADVSGRIIKTGSNVTMFKENDPVFGFIEADKVFGGRKGSLAEYAVVDTATLIKKPAHLSYEQAAGLTLASLTAICSLVDTGKLASGQRVLINGCTGGVGVMALQIAKAVVGDSGLVVGTCSQAGQDLAKKLGADQLIDYKAAPLEEQLTSQFGESPFDTIFDTVGIMSLYKASPAFLKKDGIFVNVGLQAEGILSGFMRMTEMAAVKLHPTILGGVPRQYVFAMLKATPSLVQSLAKFVQEKQLHGVTDQVYKFEDALQAYEKLMSHRAKGKIVVAVSSMD